MRFTAILSLVGIGVLGFAAVRISNGKCPLSGRSLCSSGGEDVACSAAAGEVACPQAASFAAKAACCSLDSGALAVSAEKVDAAPAGSLKGEYIEARTCDVWAAPCFANGQMGGDHAVLGWIIREGEIGGTQLEGLAVAASLDAEGTFGTPGEGKVRAVVYVDERASDAQAEALVAAAKKLAPRYTEDIVKVRRERITFRRDGMTAELEVGGASQGPEVKVVTQAIHTVRDRCCGNESKYYSALSGATSADCAKTVTHFYRGNELGPRWSDPNSRGAMVGEFAL